MQVMPDHLHGILYVKEPLDKSVGNTIRGFASGITSELRITTVNPTLKVWEKGFYVRYGADTIQLGLPFIIEKSEIDSLISALGESLAELA